MTRYAQAVTPFPSPRSVGPTATGQVLLPVVDVTHFEWAVFQWTLSNPPDGAAAGVVASWDFYVTALAYDRVQDEGVFYSLLTRPDIWIPAPWLAFPTLPNNAVSSQITGPWRCAAHTYATGVMNVTTALNRFTYNRTASGA